MKKATIGNRIVYGGIGFIIACIVDNVCIKYGRKAKIDPTTVFVTTGIIGLGIGITSRKLARKASQ